MNVSCCELVQRVSKEWAKQMIETLLVEVYAISINKRYWRVHIVFIQDYLNIITELLRSNILFA